MTDRLFYKKIKIIVVGPNYIPITGICKIRVCKIMNTFNIVVDFPVSQKVTAQIF